MKFIVALVLAIPTYGLSLVVLVVYMFFTTNSFKATMKSVILHLSKTANSRSVCVKDMNYYQALGYAEGLGSIEERRNTYVRFTVDINGNDYEVVLDKEHNSDAPILNARLV